MNLFGGHETSVPSSFEIHTLFYIVIVFLLSCMTGASYHFLKLVMSYDLGSSVRG